MRYEFTRCRRSRSACGKVKCSWEENEDVCSLIWVLIGVCPEVISMAILRTRAARMTAQAEGWDMSSRDAAEADLLAVGLNAREKRTRTYVLWFGCWSAFAPVREITAIFAPTLPKLVLSCLRLISGEMVAEYLWMWSFVLEELRMPVISSCSLRIRILIAMRWIYNASRITCEIAWWLLIYKHVYVRKNKK